MNFPDASDIHWSVIQERDNALLQNLPNVTGWATNPPEEGKTGREETVVWITDLSIVDKVPAKLFGLPTTIILEKHSYRFNEEVIVKINKLSFQDRFEDFLHTKLLFWVRNIFSQQ